MKVQYKVLTEDEIKKANLFDPFVDISGKWVSCSTQKDVYCYMEDGKGFPQAFVGGGTSAPSMFFDLVNSKWANSLEYGQVINL